MTTKPAQTVAPMELELAPAPLHGVLVYEDLTTGLRAKTVLDHLERQMDAPVDSRVDLWRFDLLDSPEVRREAVQEGVNADLVLLSAHKTASLSPGARHWLEEWLSRRGDGPCLLVLSLDRGAETLPDTAECLAYLRDMAARSGLDLLPHFGEVPEVRQDLDGLSPSHWDQYAADAPPRHHEAPPRWGINE